MKDTIDPALLKKLYGSKSSTKKATQKVLKERAICDAPCPCCGYEDLHCMSYACGIVVLNCPKCNAQGSGCSIGGAYSNMKTIGRYEKDRDTRTKAALEAIASNLEKIANTLLKEENNHGN